MRVLMWEGKGDADGLLAWWRDEAVPALPQGVTVELFRSANRVVAIVRLAADTEESDPRLRLPDPPEALCERPPHVWPFEAVSS